MALSGLRLSKMQHKLFTRCCSGSAHLSKSSAISYPDRHGLDKLLSHGAPCDIIPGETHFTELESPACLINLETVELNCREMETVAAKHDVTLRAHVKSHKNLEIAEMQVRDQTDKRIEVSTIPELYHFADRGCNDVLYGVIVSESKFKQIESIQAMQSPNIISVMTDSLYLTQKMVDYAKHNA